jgi:hypothetical protein
MIGDYAKLDGKLVQIMEEAFGIATIRFVGKGDDTIQVMLWKLKSIPIKLIKNEETQE